MILTLLRKTFSYWSRYGLKNTIKKILYRSRQTKDYEVWRKAHVPSGKELKAQREKSFLEEPLFSVVIPLYQTREIYLRSIVQSLQAQTYGNFEICFSDGSPIEDRSAIRSVIEELMNQDDRIRYIDKSENALGISENTNQALSIASGEYIVLGDHDDLYEPNALYECVKLINESLEPVDVIYTDEDKVDESGKHYSQPHFKPDFNIDFLRSGNYICHMFVFSRNIYEKIGGFRAEYNGSQDHDFILRACEAAEHIHHIPKVLYHWRMTANSTSANPESKMYCYEAGRNAVAAHLERLGIDADVSLGINYGTYVTKYKVRGEPLISIIIPNKDHVDDLKKCMDSIDQKSDYRNYEYIIIENNSENEETFDFYKSLSDRENVKVIYWDDKFNYSKINNFGVKEAKGEYLLLLNNDVTMINPDAISDMLGVCQREEVGIVGARLYYEDGTIQHAGTIIGLGGIAGHAFQSLNEDDGSVYFGRSRLSADYSAVTAACLMTKRSVFEQVGGLEPGFQVAFNDVDFCLRVRQKGYLVVYDANARFYHFESKSRGYEDTPEKQERFNREISLFEKRWYDILKDGDPYYNPNFDRRLPGFELGE